MIEYRSHQPGEGEWSGWQSIPWRALADTTPHRWAMYLLDGIDGRVVTVADSTGHYQWRFLADERGRDAHNTRALS